MYKVQSLSAPNRRNANKSRRARVSNVSKAVRPVIDTLEARHLFSSVTLSNGILTVTGNATVGSNLQVSMSSSSKINANDGHDLASNWALSSVKGIVIVGGSGADSIYEDSAVKIPTTIKSGDGNDSIRAGGGTNTIIIGNGNVWLNDRGVGGTITAGNGNDTLLATNTDTIVTGNGNSTITNGQKITVGNGNNSITSSVGADDIVVGNGKNYVNTGAGNDTIVAGTGVDTLYAGSGTNYVTIGNTKTVILPGYGKTYVTDATGAVISAPVTSNNPSVSSVAGSKTWTKYSATKSSDSTAPQAVMEVLAPALTVGIAVDVRAVASVLGAGSPVTSNYQWDFGDPSGQYNTLNGFNASHIYQTAGTYTMKLTITNSLGKTSTISASVKIAADIRRKIYVDSVGGNDSNAGTITAPLKTAAAADAKVGNDTEVLFKRGDTFAMPGTFKFSATDVLIDSYGTGALPVMEQASSDVGNGVLFSTWTDNYGTTIQNLNLTAQSPSTGVPFAFVPRGVDETIRNCTFGYVEYGVNANGGPIGLNVIGNSSPNKTGLQGYLVWAQGSDMTIIGNSAVNSVHEHIVRSSSVSDLLVADNTFSLSDDKGCIEVHAGSYSWVTGNSVTDGDIRVGPYGGTGEPVSLITQYSVIDGNMVNNSSINVDPGAHDVSVRNNIVRQDSDTALIFVSSLDGLGRYDSDIYIINNTGINTNAFGQFLEVPTATKGITLLNNLFVDPALKVGAYETAPVFVAAADLSSFTSISGNVWTTPGTYLGYADGGINFVGLSYVTAGYKSPTQWNAMTGVGTDFFAKTTLTSSFAPVTGSVAATADKAVAGNFTDYYGKTRSTSGTWSAGAVQA